MEIANAAVCEMSTNIAIVVGAIVGMEIFAWAFHKYFMHGPGWGWHESHHVHTHGVFEKNDLYGLCFSLIATGFFVAGSMGIAWMWYVGLGFTIYGVLYGFVHDGLVHQRWPFQYSPKNSYLRRLVHAHRLHHNTVTKDGAVSFGFLWAENPERLKSALKSKR